MVLAKVFNSEPFVLTSFVLLVVAVLDTWRDLID